MTPEQIIDRYQAAYGRLRTDTVAQAAALWSRFGGPREADLVRFVPAVVPIVAGAQVATARLVTGYVALMTRIAVGGAIPAPPAPLAALRGVLAAELYTRPVIAVRTALSHGKPFVEAMDLGRQRAEQLAGTDVLLAQRAATLHAVKADRRIVGYRRVITAGSCTLCAVASSEIYGPDEPMAIHVSCDCGVAPIYRTSDPAHARNETLRSTALGEAPAGGVAVHYHGELGPVLTEADHHFSAA
jgi:hypothetical protein